MSILCQKDFVARDWGEAVDHLVILCDSIREFMIISFG